MTQVIEINKNVGIRLMKDLFYGKHLLSFEQLLSKYNTPRKDLFDVYSNKELYHYSREILLLLLAIRSYSDQVGSLEEGTSRFYNKPRKLQSPNLQGR